MAKQRGGSPFTDSWFEMPFWFLLFLIVLTVVLLAAFGIFDPKISQQASSVRPTFIPGQTEHKPTFVINKAYMESLDSTYVFHSFFTAKNWTHEYELYARFVTDLNQITEFEKVDPPVKYMYKIKSPKAPISAYVEAYISLNGVPTGPTQRLDISTQG